MKRKAVYVEWLDHMAGSEAEDVKTIKPIVRRSLGWLVKDRKKYIVIAMDTSREGEEHGFAIVRDLIRDMREIEL